MKNKGGNSNKQSPVVPRKPMITKELIQDAEAELKAEKENNAKVVNVRTFSKDNTKTPNLVDDDDELDFEDPDFDALYSRHCDDDNDSP